MMKKDKKMFEFLHALSVENGEEIRFGTLVKVLARRKIKADIVDKAIGRGYLSDRVEYVRITSKGRSFIAINQLPPN